MPGSMPATPPSRKSRIVNRKSIKQIRRMNAERLRSPFRSHLHSFFFQIRVYQRPSAASFLYRFTIYDSRFTAVLLLAIYHLRFTRLGSIYLQTSNLNRHRGHCDNSRLRRGLVGDLDALSSLPSGEAVRCHHLAAGHDSAS